MVSVEQWTLSFPLYLIQKYKYNYTNWHYFLMMESYTHSKKIDYASVP